MTPAGARVWLGAGWIAFVALLAVAEARFGTDLPTACLVSILAALAAWEFHRMFPTPLPAAAGALAVAGGLLTAHLSSLAPPAWLLAAAGGAVASLLLLPRAGDGATGPRRCFAIWAAGLAYPFLAIYLIALRREGLDLLLATVGICKAGDMGAYFVGKRFGRTPLAGAISPKKTVEGAAAGLAASMLVALAAGRLAGGLGLGDDGALLVGLSIAVAGQAGDLLESLVKRKAGVKDSGRWPGLGGAMDFLDSLLAAAPVAYHLHPWLARV